MGALAAVAPVLGLVVAAGLVLGGNAAAVAVGTVGTRAEAALRAAAPSDAPSPTASDPSPTASGLSPTATAAWATPSPEEELAAQLARQPWGAKVVGNTIVYANGAIVYTAIDAGVLSLSSCTAGHFCIWDQSYYQGSLWLVSLEGVSVAMPTYFGQIGSLWNNRGGRTLMFPSLSTTSPTYCYAPGARLSTVSGTRAALRGAFLSTYPAC